MHLSFKKSNGKTGTITTGFTIIEALVSAAIAAILFVSLFYGLSEGYSIIQFQRENLRATQIMISRMEGLRLCLWSTNQLFNTTVVPNTFTDYFYPSQLGGFPSNDVTYNGTMTITTNPSCINAGYSNNMALVVVTVNWNDIKNGQINAHTKTMSTYVAQYGVQTYVYNH
jgi:type II secretory pathway pseudopilin PulG